MVQSTKEARLLNNDRTRSKPATCLRTDICEPPQRTTIVPEASKPAEHIIE
jgi:hypothetical protein